MPKATITVDEQEAIEVIRDEWGPLAEDIGGEIRTALSVTPPPDEITISLAGMTMTEWESLPEETRRDLQEYGAD